jgi:folate-binding Fe-S cluster repair protein YgfZ
MVETALHAHLAAHGAVHADDRGVALARHFGDAAGEYRALRETVALIDLGFRTILRATGADRVTFLQGMLTNDVATIAPDEARAALLLTIQGRVTADVRVATADDVLLLDVDVRVRDAMTAALDKLIIADDVELTPSATAVLGLEGPGAATFVADGVAGARLLRGGELGTDSIVVHAPVGGEANVWDELYASG